MATEHVDIIDPEIHEPKGVAAASSNEVYMADGAGSGDWIQQTAHAGCYFASAGTDFTPAAADTYEVLGVGTTVETSVHEFTHTTPTKLTYTGTKNRRAHIAFNISFKAKSTTDTYTFALYKNGAIETGAEMVRYATNGQYGTLTLHWDCAMITNDYIEIYLKGTAGNTITVTNFYFFVLGMAD